MEKGHFFSSPRKGGTTMPVVYKIDILAALKEAGYNTNRLRKEKLLSEGVIQSLRENKYISLQNISKICELLDCQPADLLEYVKE
jgi:putative transcriptional regulator